MRLLIKILFWRNVILNTHPNEYQIDALLIYICCWRIELIFVLQLLKTTIKWIVCGYTQFNIYILKKKKFVNFAIYILFTKHMQLYMKREGTGACY